MKDKNRQHLIYHLMVICLFLILPPGCDKDDPVELPAPGNLAVSDITASSAVISGSLEHDGGAAVTDMGIVWGLSPSPSLESHEGKISAGDNDENFNLTITDLSAGTKYYVRGYATNSEGTAYSNQISFTTEGEPATITTTEVTDITSNSAKSGGNVTDDGGANVTARGVVWSSSENPSVEDNEGITEDGSGTGGFTSELEDLQPATTYFVRAYATNSAGTVYGNQVDFKSSAGVPTVITADVTEITTTTAKTGGNVTDDGGSEVIDRGVIWATYENPTLQYHQRKSNVGTGTGSFETVLLRNEPSTTYYVRAYATNSQGTAYGEQKSFETVIETGTFSDQRDGQEYKWVRIGDQVWMAENLKYLPEVSPSSETSWTNPHYYVIHYQGTDLSEAIATDNYQNYGVLYNWPAAMKGEESSNTNPSGVQGVCPAGWHLPSNAEWNELVDYVVSQGYHNESDNANGAGNALKSCRQVGSPLGGECNTSEHPRWDSDDTHYGIDQFGFSALPGGNRYLDVFSAVGGSGLWWSSVEASSDRAWARLIHKSFGNVHYDDYLANRGSSVRCVRD